jgi:hypothetical protein
MLPARRRFDRPARGWRFRVLALGSIALPGALAGIYTAGLLFFLNPHWPFEIAPVLRAVVRYGLLLASFSALVLGPFALRRPRGLRLWPWGLIVLFAATGVVFWVQAAHYSLFLPPGINRRLLKAAIGFSAAAVVGFYAVALAVLRRRRLGVGTKLLFGLLVFTTVYVLFERRESFRPAPPLSPRPSRVAQAARPNLLFVAAPTATLDVVLPLAEQGQLPFLTSCLRQGAHSRVLTLEPTVPLAAWASVASGRLPYQHGLLNGDRYAADFIGPGLDLRLVPTGLLFRRWAQVGGVLATPAAAQSLTLWEIMGRLGIESTVAGWPLALVDPGARPGAARPGGARIKVTSLESALELGPDAAVMGVPDHGPVPQRGAEVPTAAVSALDGVVTALDGVVTAAPAQARFLFLSSLERAALETYGAYVDIHVEGRPDAKAGERSRALISSYVVLDNTLEKLWAATAAPRLLVVVSAYGVRERGSLLLGRVGQGEASFHGEIRGAPDGMLVMCGDGIRAAGFVPSVSVLDLVPTLLYGLGLPVARDLAGRTLTEVFEPELLDRRPLTFVPSYETALPVGAGDRR